MACIANVVLRETIAPLWMRSCLSLYRFVYDE